MGFKSPQSAYYSLSIANFGQVDMGALQESGNVSAAATYSGIQNGKVLTAKTVLTITLAGGGAALKVGHTLNVSGTNVAATGTVTLASALAGDTVTVNGLLYTAVSGAKADDTEFSIDTSDTAAATDLADSIDDDVRVGTLDDLSALGASAVVTATHSVPGPTGNVITLESSNGTRLEVSGALFTGGAGVDGLRPIIKVVDGTNYVIDVAFSNDTSGTWTSLGAKGVFAGFVPMTTISAGDITSITYHTDGAKAHIGDPTLLAYIAGVFYPFPGLIDEIIITLGNLRLIRYTITDPQ